MATGAPGEQARTSLADEARESVRVLIVDDERSLRESCTALLKSAGYSVSACSRGDDAIRMVRTQEVDIIVVDLYTPRASGLEVVKAAVEAKPDILAIVMTATPSVESSVTALQAGAWDYLPKPFSATHFEILLGRAAHAVMVARESSGGPPAVGDHGHIAVWRGQGGELPLYGVSQSLKRVIALADKVAGTDASVFLTGESGTGKEIIAHYIHWNSRRSSRELVPLNCAAIPEALLESEMFGHVKGAFTGAVRDKEGLLEAAHGGTLFLDELTELPLPTQAKLLRVLQDGVVRRVGSTKTDAVVNVRFIAATNRDPLEAVREGQLRKDLHYRLRVVPIHIPALRERTEDIPVLADAFLKEFWTQHRDGRAAAPTLSGEAMTRLRRAPWKGNVRELRNVVEHLAVMSEPGATIGPEDIMFMDEMDFAAAPMAASAGLNDLDYHSAREHVLSRFEMDYLSHVVAAANGNISDAARLAGVDRTTLYRLMDKHGIGRESLAADERP